MDIEVVDISKIKNKNILAVGAHPDDIEFGCGGTTSLLSKENLITLLIFTDGRMGTHDAQAKPQELARMRNEETKAAARILGTKEVLFWDYPDTELVSYEKNFRKRLLKFFLKLRPEMIFSPDPWGRYEPLLHPDHRIVAWAAVESVLFGTLPLYLKKRGIDSPPLTPKPQIWLYAPAEPNVGLDVNGTLKNKINALAQHKSQFDQLEFEEVKKRVRERAKIAGDKVNIKFAELFRILR